jgi:hypothetical protein
MKNTIFFVSGAISLTACSVTPQQSLEVLGSMVVQEKYKEQSQRICAQQTNGALRLQCLQQAQRDFQKFQKEQGKITDE